MIYPDDFSNPVKYSFRGQYYAIHDNTWYLLWSYRPQEVCQARLVSDVDLIMLLDLGAVANGAS